MKGGLLLLLCMTFIPDAIPDAMAQRRRYGAADSPRQSAGVTYSLTDFSAGGASCVVPDGEGGCSQFQKFEFNEPVLGLFYSRPGIQLFFGRGTQSASSEEGGDKELLETVINITGTLKPFPVSRESTLQFVLPIGIHSDYRRVTEEIDNVSIDQFETTVVAIGGGVGVNRVVGMTQFSSRFMSYFGLASRSLGFGNGTSLLFEADIDITFGPISGNLGVAVGYSFRWQKWNLKEQISSGDDFEGMQHGVRVGVFW